MALVLFRVGFGLLMVVLVLRYFANGWIDAQFHEPARFLGWFSWVRPWPRPWMHVHFAALGLLGALIAAGLFTRTSALLFCLGFTYVHLIDRTYYLNHYYLISLLSGLLAFLPLGGRGRPAPAGSLWLLRFQVGVVYFFAGVAKLQEDWLLRAQPMRLWLADVPALGEPWVAFAASWGAAAFDLALPFLLLGRRTRPWALGAAVLFHAATALLFPLGLFPWVMVVSLLVFVPGDVEPAFPSRAPARALVAAYAALQLILPLRFLLDPGDPLLTDHRFSWRVMVAEKRGEARFTARDPRTGERREVPVRDYLTPVQAHYMAAEPDLIRAFARLVREDYARRGRSVEVDAEARISVNGRPGEVYRLDSSRSWVKPIR